MDYLEHNQEFWDSRLGRFIGLTIFVALVWAVVIFVYRSILGFWDVEDIWEMPYRTYTYIISLITIVATIAVLIKIKRADDAALEESED